MRTHTLQRHLPDDHAPPGPGPTSAEGASGPRHLLLLSISLSPEEDSPAALKVYAKMHNVGVATVIQPEADAPLKGSVAGVRQEDVVSKAVNVGTDFFSFAADISETLSALVKLCFSVR